MLDVLSRMLNTVNSRNMQVRIIEIIHIDYDLTLCTSPCAFSFTQLKPDIAVVWEPSQALSFIGQRHFFCQQKGIPL